MTALVLTKFGGMYPRFGDQLIGANAAVRAVNCRLLSGQLQALKRPAPLASFSQWSETIQRVFRVTTPDGGFYAVFDDPTTDFVRAPLTQDGYNRHYWTQVDERPRYATGAQLEADFDAHDVPTGLLLGIPAPTTAPTVTVRTAGLPAAAAVPLDADVRLTVEAEANLSQFASLIDTLNRCEANVYLRSSATGNLYAPSVTAEALEETRVYVYTFVSAYGEEGAPSPPTIVDGNTDSEWHLTELETTVPDATERNITEIKIYRTITGTLGATEYFLVTTQPIGTTEYVDTAGTDEIALNPTLESNSWNEPPEGLTGLVVHPNGFLVGFKDRDVYFSVPYRPHAWPVEYIQTMKWNVTAVEILGQSVIVLTESCPYVATGVRPEAMTLVQRNTATPCTSRRGVVATNSGVLFPSPDGLMVIGEAGEPLNVTKPFLTRREWLTRYRPWELDAVRQDTQYVAFYAGNEGFAIDFQEAEQAFIELGPVGDSDEWDHFAIQNDPVTGNVWMLRSDKSLRVFNPERGSPVTYLWRSREFDMVEPVNFGAYKVTYSDVSELGRYDSATLDAQRAFNEERTLQPLNPLNFNVLGGSRNVALTSTLPQNRTGSHHSPLYRLVASSVDTSLTFRIYVNREVDPVHEQVITDREMYRPPTGFREILWQFELEGNAEIQHVKLAETAVELGRV